LITGYWVADLALILWIPLSAFVLMGLRPALGVSVVMIGGMLFLPPAHGFDFQGLPPLDKHSISSLAVLVGTLLVARRRLAAARPGRGYELLVLLMVVAAVGTVKTNEDPLHYGPATLSALTPYDALSMGASDLLQFGVPFFVGRVIFLRRRDLEDLLLVFVSGAIVYSAAILFEAKMSPQLNILVYGYHQHSFAQTVRFGGWRPVVFMEHGLAVALFLVVATIAATMLWRARKRVMSLGAGPVATWLGFCLVLCRSTAALVYGALLVPMAALARPRTQLRVASILALLVISYPVLRMTDHFPTKQLLAVASSLSPDRAESLEVRFENEELLVAKARDRLLFGWGGYGRNRVRDAEEGRDVSTTDGFWIIILSSRGMMGFLTTFGLLVLPIATARHAFRRVRDRRDRLLLSGLSLIVAIYALDLLPNGLFTNIPYLMAGALEGFSRSFLRDRQSLRLPDRAHRSHQPERDSIRTAARSRLQRST